MGHSSSKYCDRSSIFRLKFSYGEVGGNYFLQIIPSLLPSNYSKRKCHSYVVYQKIVFLLLLIVKLHSRVSNSNKRTPRSHYTGNHCLNINALELTSYPETQCKLLIFEDDALFNIRHGRRPWTRFVPKRILWNIESLTL